MSQHKPQTPGDAIKDVYFANHGVSTGTAFNSLLLEQKRQSDELSRRRQVASTPSAPVGPVTAIIGLALTLGLMAVIYYSMIMVGGQQGLIYTGAGVAAYALIVWILRTDLVNGILGVLDGVVLFLLRIVVVAGLVFGALYLLGRAG